MKRSLWIVALVGVLGLGVFAVAQQEAGETAASGLDPEVQKDILTLMDVTGEMEQQKQFPALLLNQFRQRMPQLPAEFWDRVAPKISSDELTASLVPVYAKHMTKEDVKGLIEFYQSPLGKRYVQARAAMQQETQQASMAWVQKVQMAVVLELQAMQQQQQQAQPEAQPQPDTKPEAESQPEAKPEAAPTESPSGL